LHVDISQSARKLRSFFDKNDECSHFASCWSGFEAQYVLHNVLRVKCSNLGVYTSIYLNREENYGHFSTITMNARILRVVGLVSRLNTSCSMFCASNAVVSALTRRNISIGRKITVLFRQKRRMFAFCELSGLFPSLPQCAQGSALNMQ
jgi:hypothetical protein